MHGAFARERFLRPLHFLEGDLGSRGDQHAREQTEGLRLDAHVRATAHAVRLKARFQRAGPAAESERTIFDLPLAVLLAPSARTCERTRSASFRAHLGRIPRPGKLHAQRQRGAGELGQRRGQIAFDADEIRIHAPLPARRLRVGGGHVQKVAAPGGFAGQIRNDLELRQGHQLLRIDDALRLY